MFSVFPDLLTFSFFAPTILRILSGAFFLYSAIALGKRTRINPKDSTPFTWYLIVVQTFVGASLFVGAWTQIGALLGFFTALKLMYSTKKKQHLAPQSMSTYILLAGICLSLLVSTAGAFAFDLPL